VHVLHEQPDAAAGEAVLRLMVPRQEIRITASGIELRALSAGELAALEAAVAAAAGPVDAPAVTPLSADGAAHGAQAYRQVVADAVRDIRARRLQKVILSREVPIEHDVDLYATYEAGRRGNTPARSFLLDLGDLRCAGFSPETVLEVAADGRVATQPLAGTRAFMGDAHVDAGLRADLLEDVKEIFEHAISVKLACDELRAICAGGSVQVGEFMDVAERGSVQHLASRVSGVLAPGRNAWHAMATLFPAITASGVPKVAACSAIRRYEQQPRGLYSGAVLTVDADGGLDAALVLRSIFQAGGRTWLRAGAGVVEHSTPEREYEETCEKLRSISRFIVAAQP
jgi:salicylate synthetase